MFVLSFFFSTLDNCTNKISEHFFDSLEQNNIAPLVIDLRLRATDYANEAKWDSAKYYYEKALERSRQIENDQLIAYNLTSLQLIYFYQGDYEKVELYNREITSLKEVFYHIRSNAHSSLAHHFIRKSMLDSAELYAMKSVAIDRANKELSNIHLSLLTLGRIKSYLGKNREALDHYLEALDNLEEEDNGLNKAQILKFISGAFLSINNTEKAKEYLELCIEICNENELNNLLTSAKITQANILRSEKKFVESELAFRRIIPLAKNRMSKGLYDSCLLGLAQCKLEQDQSDQALALLDSITSVHDSKHNQVFINKYHITLAHYYIIANSEQAEAQLQKVSELSQKTHDLHFKRKFHFLNYQYHKKTNPAQALDNYEKFGSLSDSIFQMQQSHHMNQMEAQYDLVNKEKQIAILDAENAVSELKITQQKRTVLFTSLGLGSFILLSFFLYSLMKRVKSQNSALELANNEKSTLLREIHHRVKNNLQVISSLLALQSSYIKDDSAISALKQGQDRVQSMALIHQDLYQKDNLSGVNCNEYFSKLIANLTESYTLSDKEIDLDLKVEPLMLDVDTMIPLGLVLNELISNSIKHAFHDQKKGKITVLLEQKGPELILEVNDNGRGVDSKDDLNGNSFGYELIRAFAQKLNATIENNFEQGFGTKLRIKNFKLAA